MLLITAFWKVVSGWVVPKATGAAALAMGAVETDGVGADALATGTVAGWRNASTSAAVIRPLGPVPEILVKSILLSLAILLALGDTI